MGIRFDCPNGHELHVKSFLAGKKGVCPKCSAKLVIPSVAEQASNADATQTALRSSPSTAAIVAAKRTEDSPSSSDDMHWYVRLGSGDQFGPATSELFAEWRRSGRIPVTALVWREGWDRWKPAATLPPLAPDEQIAATKWQPPPTTAQREPKLGAMVSSRGELGRVDSTTISSQTNASDGLNNLHIVTDRPPLRTTNRGSRALVWSLAAICLIMFGVLIWVLQTSL